MSVSEQRTRPVRKCPLFEGRQSNFTFEPSWAPLCTPHGEAGMDIPPPTAGPTPEAWAPAFPEWGSDSGCRRPRAPQTSSHLFLPPSPARGHQSGLHRPQVTAPVQGLRSSLPFQFYLPWADLLLSGPLGRGWALPGASADCDSPGGPGPLPGPPSVPACPSSL